MKQKINTYDVAIAGGGLGGLAAAIALEAQGFRVCVLERAKRPQSEGAGIQIGPNASKILNALDLLKPIERHATRVEQIHVHDGITGHSLTHIPIGDLIEKRHGAPHMVIHRADLHKTLHIVAERSKRIDIVPGANVETFADDGEKVMIKITGGNSYRAHILVCADGVFSQLRRLILNDGPPKSAGLIAWRTLIAPQEAPPEFQAQETGLWMAPNTHMVHYRVRQGALLNVVAMSEGEAEIQGWSKPGDKQKLIKAFAHTARPMRKLIEKAQTWYSWPLFGRPEPAQYSKGRVVLLGDAAHPTLPCLAQGGAMAIEDGFVLARCLINYIDKPELALKAYDRLRLQRTIRLQQASNKAAEIYHMGGAARLARNLTLRAAEYFAPEKILAAYDWLYSYNPVTGPLEPPS